MTLIDHFRADIAPLNDKAATQRRRLWHLSAKRVLHMLALTSDPLPNMPSQLVRVDVRNSDPRAERYRVTTVPFLPFFLRHDIAELEELYRITNHPTRKDS